MDLTEFCVVILAGFFSAVIKNGVGVGSGIFLLPVLSLVFPAKVALGIGGPIMLGSDLIGLRNYWREWLEWKQLCRLMGAAVPGLLLGTFLIPIIPGQVFRAAVGIFGMCYSVCLLFPAIPKVIFPQRSLGPRKASGGFDLSTMLYGMLGGVATVLAHAGGLVWSIYLIASDVDRRVFVGTLVIMFATTNLYKTIAYMQIGILSLPMLGMALMALPGIWFGAQVGNLCNRKVNRDLFRKAVLVVIFCVSALLLR